jgi:hypothetical protein
LSGPSGVVDAVDYSVGSFPLAPGKAMSLDPGAFDATSNDAAASWCSAAAQYGAGDFGSPGALNPLCGSP